MTKVVSAPAGPTVTVAEAAELLGIQRRQVRRMIDDGRLVAVSPERPVRILAADVKKARKTIRRREPRYLTAFRKRRTIAAWSKATGLSIPILTGRIKLGWPAERVLSEPVRTHGAKS